MQVSIQCGERLERTVRPLLARRTSCECPPSRRISRRSRAVTPSDTGLLRTMSGRRPVRERPRNRLGSRRRRNARLRNSVVLNQRWREPCSSMIRSQPTSHPFRPGGPAVDGRVYRDRGCSWTSRIDSNRNTPSKESAPNARHDVLAQRSEEQVAAVVPSLGRGVLVLGLPARFGGGEGEPNRGRQMWT